MSARSKAADRRLSNYVSNAGVILFKYGNVDSAPVESAPIEIGAQGRPTNKQYGAPGNLHKILMNTVTVDIM